MPIALVLIHVGLSALVGYLGRRREIGFAGFFVLSVLISPVITALILLVTAQRSQVEKS